VGKREDLRKEIEYMGEGKNRPGRSRHRWKEDIRMDISEIGWVARG